MALYSDDGYFNIEIVSATGVKSRKCVEGKSATSPTQEFRCLFVLRMLPWLTKRSMQVAANAAQQGHREQVWFERHFKGDSG